MMNFVNEHGIIFPALFQQNKGRRLSRLTSNLNNKPSDIIKIWTMFACWKRTFTKLTFNLYGF